MPNVMRFGEKNKTTAGRAELLLRPDIGAAQQVPPHWHHALAAPPMEYPASGLFALRDDCSSQAAAKARASA